MDSSCKFPWTWINVKVQNDKWRFCCKTLYNDYDVFQKNLEDVKESFLNKEQHPSCNACWVPESKGFKSYRIVQGGVTKSENIINLYRKKPSVEWIDVEFGDTCNMYCLTCGPSNSTLWQQMLNQYPNSNNKFDETWAKLVLLIEENIDSIDHLNLYGGEPSIDTGFYKIVDSLLSLKLSKPIGIHLYTNGNYSDNHRVKFEKAIENLTNHGYRMELNFSLDAVGEDGEFIRAGLVFRRFEKNLITMINKGHIPRINITLSVLNIENHLEIYNWLNEKNIADKIIPKFNTVSNPKHFNISILGNKINEFKKPYPDNMINEQWDYYKTRSENFFNVNSQAEPDQKSILTCIDKIKTLSTLSGKPIPKYYQSLIEKLSSL